MAHSLLHVILLACVLFVLALIEAFRHLCVFIASGFYTGFVIGWVKRAFAWSIMKVYEEDWAQEPEKLRPWVVKIL